jgi:hypothetical protein
MNSLVGKDRDKDDDGPIQPQGIGHRASIGKKEAT